MKLCFYIWACMSLWVSVCAFFFLAHKFDKSLYGVVFFHRIFFMDAVCMTAGAMGIAYVIWRSFGEALILKQGLCLCGAATGLFAGCLAFACMTDTKVCEAYDFCWWLSVPAVFYLWAKASPEVFELIELAVFFLMQQHLFSKWIGKADCHAFCVCALFESTLGMHMDVFFRHMILAYGMLIIHQLYKNNIGRRGRLKTPVPFLPYIAFSFLTNIWIV